MNFVYENQGHITYLSYAIAQDDVLDTMSLGMVTNNKISGLAPSIFTQMDTTKYIKYDVSAKISVKQFFDGPVNKKRLIGVFNGIVDAMLSAEDYMIDVNSIILDLNYIFTDVSTCETVLICLPIISDDLRKTDLGTFFKNIMFTTQFDQTENCDHVAKIINYLNSSPVFSLEDFKKLLESISGAISNGQAQQSVIQKNQPPQPVVQQPVVQQPVVQADVQQKNAPNVQQNVSQHSVNQYGSNQINTQVPFAQPMSSVQQQGESEKKSSFFRRWMNNKDNSESSKQKNAEKKTKTVTAPNPKQSKNAQAGFAIPGQNAPVNQGFAIPGTPATVRQGAMTQPSIQSAESVQTPMQQKASMQQSVQQKGFVQQPVSQVAVNPPTYSQPQIPQGSPMSFGETTVLGGGGIGETTVLGATPATQVKPHLLRIKNNEIINLDKPVFKIGKEKSYVDYFIGDNPAISRSHANVISRNGEFFVVDTNSTNHTYVNGQMIQSNIEIKISHSNRIKFANEEFEFKLY